MPRRKYVAVVRYIKMMKASMNRLLLFLKKRRYIRDAIKGGTNSNAIVSSVRSCNAISILTPGDIGISTQILKRKRFVGQTLDESFLYTST